VDAGVLTPYTVDVTLTNRSDRDGVQIVQVYAHRLQRDGVRADEPDQKLVGFVKVDVPGGATVTAVVHLDARGYREWNETTNAWSAVPGTFELRVGLSSRNIAHTLEVIP
jgi:beta-glucosidase